MKSPNQSPRRKSLQSKSSPGEKDELNLWHAIERELRAKLTPRDASRAIGELKRWVGLASLLDQIKTAPRPLQAKKTLDSLATIIERTCKLLERLDPHLAAHLLGANSLRSAVEKHGVKFAAPAHNENSAALPTVIQLGLGPLLELLEAVAGAIKSAAKDLPRSKGGPRNPLVPFPLFDPKQNAFGIVTRSLADTGRRFSTEEIEHIAELFFEIATGRKESFERTRKVVSSRVGPGTEPVPK